MTRLAAPRDLKAAIEANEPEMVALEKDCGARLAAAMHQAGGHEGGCSPYQLGLRAEPASMIPMIRIAQLLGFRARLVADKDPMKALGILLDALRFEQDLERGHVTLIAAMIATAAGEILATRAGAILDTAKLSKAQLDALAPALDRLIAGLPSFHEILQGEREAMALYFGVGLLEGPDWVPPGGWPTGMTAHGNQGTASGKHFGDPRDEAAAELAGMMQAADERDRACPAQATLATCKAGLDGLGNAAPKELDIVALYKQGLADPDAMRRSIRTQIVNVLASIVQPNFGKYVDKVLGTLTHLAELRIHVEALRTHTCPPLYAVPPALGQPLDVQADKGTVTVGTWSFRCR